MDRHTKIKNWETGAETERKSGKDINAGELLMFSLIIAGIVINIIPFEIFGLNTRFSGYPTILALADFGTVSPKTIQERRGLYLDLGRIAPNADMLLPTGESIDIAQLYGFGRIKNAKFMNYDPESFAPGFLPSNHIIATYNGDRRLGPGPYAIAAGKRTVDTMILLRRNDTWFLVDTSLLPPGPIESLRQ